MLISTMPMQIESVREEGTVIFQDGSEVCANIILHCTGYVPIIFHCSGYADCSIHLVNCRNSVIDK